MEADARGRVILLNGASSSGKTSIGRALQRVLADPWFLFPVDSLGAMRSTDHTRALDAAEVETMLRRTRMGYHRAVAALACVGNDVIMDYPLSEPWRLADLLVVLEDYDVTTVDVRCRPDELERRERARGDRDRAPCTRPRQGLRPAPADGGAAPRVRTCFQRRRRVCDFVR